MTETTWRAELKAPSNPPFRDRCAHSCPSNGLGRSWTSRSFLIFPGWVGALSPGPDGKHKTPDGCDSRKGWALLPTPQSPPWAEGGDKAPRCGGVSSRGRVELAHCASHGVPPGPAHMALSTVDWKWLCAGCRLSALPTKTALTFFRKQKQQ